MSGNDIEFLSLVGACFLAGAGIALMIVGAIPVIPRRSINTRDTGDTPTNVSPPTFPGVTMSQAVPLYIGWNPGAPIMAVTTTDADASSVTLFDTNGAPIVDVTLGRDLRYYEITPSGHPSVKVPPVPCGQQFHRPV